MIPVSAVHKHKLFLFKHAGWRLVRQIFQHLEKRLPNQGKKERENHESIQDCERKDLDSNVRLNWLKEMDVECIISHHKIQK